MKNILTALALIFSATAFSQVIINADQATAKSSLTNLTSVLLEFGNDNNKGIILPYVETLPAAAVGGTLVFDISSPTQYKIKVKNQNNSGTGWIDLSGNSGYNILTDSTVRQPQLLPLQDQTGAKAVIGSQTSTADGILVLESNTKAMILPKVSNVNNIPSPSPGMMVFVEGATPEAHRLAFFNGSTWSFWKP